MILENVSDEFLDWLEQCPVQWFLERQENDGIVYWFSKEVN